MQYTLGSPPGAAILHLHITQPAPFFSAKLGCSSEVLHSPVIFRTVLVIYVFVLYNTASYKMNSIIQFIYSHELYFT